MSSARRQSAPTLLLAASFHLSRSSSTSPLRPSFPQLPPSGEETATAFWSLLAFWVASLGGFGPFWASSFYKRSVTRAHAEPSRTRSQLRRSRQQGRMGPLPPLPRLLVGTVPFGSNEAIDHALWTRSYGFRHHKSLCNTSAARKKCVNSQADTTRRGRAWPCTVSDCCVATHDEFDERRRDAASLRRSSNSSVHRVAYRYMETCI